MLFSPGPIDRAQVRLLYLLLAGGVAMALVACAVLVALGLVPLLPGDVPRSVILVMAGAALSAYLLGWSWARPRIVARQPGQSESDFWLASEAGRAAVVLWSVWEGGAMLATIGTALTGSGVLGVTALFGLGLLMVHGPVQLERTG